MSKLDRTRETGVIPPGRLSPGFSLRLDPARFAETAHLRGIEARDSAGDWRSVVVGSVTPTNATRTPFFSRITAGGKSLFPVFLSHESCSRSPCSSLLSSVFGISSARRRFPVSRNSRIDPEGVQRRDDRFSARPGSHGRTLKRVAAVEREHRPRSAGSLLVEYSADAGEPAHPMQMLGVFGQILPVRVKLGVHVGQMQEPDLLRGAGAAFNRGCSPAVANSKTAAAALSSNIDLLTRSFNCFVCLVYEERSSWGTSW